MKPSFSFGDAIEAPLVLIRRRPFAVFVWGLLMIAVVAAIYAMLLPILINLPWEQADAAMEAYIGEMIQVQLVSNALTIVMYLVMLVVFTAAGRATLDADRGDRFLFLRLGMDEVRVAVVVVACFVGWYVALLLLILIGVGLGLALYAAGQATMMITLLIYGLVVFVASLIGWARISLIAPATLILGRFAFAEGWTIAKGQVLKLLGLNVLIWLIYMICYIALALVVAAILIGGFFAQGLTWPQNVQHPQDLMPIVQPMLIPLAATVPVFAFGYGAYMALVSAPFVRAARQLLDGAPVVRPDIGQDAAPEDTLQTP